MQLKITKLFSISIYQNPGYCNLKKFYNFRKSFVRVLDADAEKFCIFIAFQQLHQDPDKWCPKITLHDIIELNSNIISLRLQDGR